MTTSFIVDGITNPEDGFVANFRRVAPDYFKTLRTSIVEGREFSQTDISNSMPVAIVSREFEKHFWPGQSAIGKRIQRQSQTDHNWRTIIGVVNDVKDSSLTAIPGLTLYIPYFQSSIPSFYLVVRSATNPSQVIEPLRGAVRELDKDVPLYQIATAEELFSDSLSRPRFAAYLLASFALIGLFVALIGIYGVVSYTTNRRVNEIGLRMAIGASKKSILFLILQQSARLILWGLLSGSVMAMIFERWLRSLWNESGNPSIYIVTAAILTFAALLSSLLPALRATRINPTIALRYQ
jgi:putative ABC transport system permease protein